MSQSNNSTVVDVAVGVVSRADGQVLLGQRPTGKPYAGWWEFPGGKVEPGESVHDALARELTEELGLQIHQSSPWVVREHAYEHAHVRLHFRRVTSFSGEPESREGQAFTWSHPGEAQVEPLLPATVPLMRLLTLPAFYGISCAALIGPDAFLDQLDSVLTHRSAMVQLREPALSEHDFGNLFTQTLDICREHGAILLVNSGHPSRYWAQADGVHLRSGDTSKLPSHASGAVRRLEWIAASCHDADELNAAATAGADFVTLSPIKETQSHPDAKPMGWRALTEVVQSSPVPVYALGGMTTGDLAVANAAGAQGVAMIRGLFGT